MNVLEKILEEIKDNAKLGNMHWENIRIEKSRGNHPFPHGRDYKYVWKKIN